MRGITDIHSHILHDVDDGAESIEESIEILKREYAQGVTSVILTPHYHLGECMPEPEIVKEHYEELQSRINEIIPEMELYLGNEIMACNDMVDILNAGKLFSLAGTQYVLVEFYPLVDYQIMERNLNVLLQGGYIPIVAHCERYRCLRTTFWGVNVKHVRHLTEMGVYMQVNASSVYGKDKKFVSKLINKDLLHLVASDVHGLDKRGVYWDKCIKYLTKKYDKEYIDLLLVENPKKILNNEYI